jgi:hypothetical protein
MNPKETYCLLGQCLVMDEYPGPRDRVPERVARPSFSWELFVYMASNHLVLPAVYHKFLARGLLDIIPADLAEHLAEIFSINK